MKQQLTEGGKTMLSARLYQMARVHRKAAPILLAPESFWNLSLFQ
jgi:hypothetical protein